MQDKQQGNLLGCYARLPVQFTHGKGVYLFDKFGSQYLDGLSGIAVTILGHCHPRIIEAINFQANKALHYSNVYSIKEQEDFANVLTSLTDLPYHFICNSGAESVELAIKMNRLYGHAKGISVPKMLVFDSAFHGRTTGAISAGNPKYQVGFEPALEGFVRIPFNNISALQKAIAENNDITSVMVEPIQGEGGINVASVEFLQEIDQLCKKNNLIFISDEIQTGKGRTGKFLATEHAAIKPDMVLLAKGLANGIPIGSCSMSKSIADLIKVGQHGSTFGGNPFACYVAKVCMETLIKEKYISNAAKIGKKLISFLKKDLDGMAEVKDIRGKGLMIGIELDRPCREMMKLGLQNRILFNITNEKVVRLLPALILDEEQAYDMSHRISKTIKSFIQSSSS